MPPARTCRRAGVVRVLVDGELHLVPCLQYSWARATTSRATITPSPVPSTADRHEQRGRGMAGALPMISWFRMRTNDGTFKIVPVAGFDSTGPSTRGSPRGRTDALVVDLMP